MTENMESDGAKKTQIAELQEEVQALRALIQPGTTLVTPTASAEPPAAASGPRGILPARGVPAGRRARKTRTPSILAAGYTTTTVPGSLYNSILRTLAVLGRLELHEHLFGKFAKDPSPESARALLEKVGVYFVELQQVLFADLQYRKHQARRTLLLKNRSAKGDAKAKAILQDPEISDGHGNWKGDLEEAVEILYGGRQPGQLQHGRNVRILHRSKLMFDRGYRDSAMVVYLYPRKFHRLFIRARALAGR